MGNSSSKNSQQSAPRPGTLRHTSERTAAGQPSPGSQVPHPPTERLVTQIYSTRAPPRGSRHDLPFLSLGRDREGVDLAPERPRETKQEREARKTEKERQARVKERERSLREEHVDGGFLVTLGTYTGPEDFSKGIVRQLQVSNMAMEYLRAVLMACID